MYISASVCARVCVSCVCSTLSPGTSAMPPLSQFLASPLKNMLIQTNLLFLLCFSHPSVSSWDGLVETYNQSRRSSPTARLFDFSTFLSCFILLFQIVSLPPSRLPQEAMRKLVNRKQLVHAAYFVCRFNYCTHLHRECSLARDTVTVSRHGGRHQKSCVFTVSIALQLQ